MISTEMVTAQNSNNNQSTKIDFTEFVRELGKQYGEMNYEAAETPEDLQSTIDWADTNFYESDSLNWMLGENSEYSEIASIFDDMEWEEYHNYEDIFVEAAKEKMEECLTDWESNLADEIEAEHAARIATDAENFFESIKCYGIESYDEIDQIEDLEIKQYVLERTKDALHDAEWEVNDMFDKIGALYGCSSVGSDDGFAVNLPIMKFFGFNESEYGYDNMSYCMDYIEEKYNEVWDKLDDVEYQIKNQVTVSA